MRTRGDQIIMDDQYAVDSIRPKCVELQRMCEQYKDLLRKRRHTLTKSHDLHDRLDRVSAIVIAIPKLLMKDCSLKAG